MKRMKLLVVLLMVTFTLAFCQEDKIFKERVTFEKGFDFVKGGTPQTMPYTGGTTTTVDWLSITGKPSTFPSTWATVSGKPTVFNSDLTVTNPLYRAITWKPDYVTDVVNKPTEIQLDVAISQLSGVKLPVLTTTQINALMPTMGLLVYDQTLNVLKIWTGTWKILITAN